ncbi:MAG: hypothetical protein WA761_06055 [Thermoplasmata archaeon]
MRMIRWEGTKGLVEIGHTDVAVARKAWNGPVAGPFGSFTLRTHATWGTLLKGKVWLRKGRP